jgi:hypothetical protein
MLVLLRVSRQPSQISSLFVADTTLIVTRQKENAHITIQQKNVNFSQNVLMEINACIFIQKPFANLLMHAQG